MQMHFNVILFPFKSEYNIRVETQRVLPKASGLSVIPSPYADTFLAIEGQINNLRFFSYVPYV